MYFIPLIVIILCYGSILISISLKSREENRSMSRVAINSNFIGEDVPPVGSPTSTLISAVKMSLRKKAHSLSTITSVQFNNNNNNNISNFKSALRKSRSSICADLEVNGNTTTTKMSGGGNKKESKESNYSTALRRTGGSDSFQTAKNRTLRMTVVLVLAFLLCWTPYTVAMFIHFLWNASGSQNR